MKIGIVTFYRVANYGAMLQAYALWKSLESNGHEVVFIQHPRVAPARISLLGCFISRHLQGVRNKLRSYVRHSMTRFAESYPQTMRCKAWGDLVRVGRECDAFVVGSDQMWNPLWCANEYLPFVMLDFAAEGKRRLSYAVSFGEKDWRTDQNFAVASRLLKKFCAISVREKSGLDVVFKLSGRTDAECLVDPTLLHESAFYQSLLTGPFHEGAPYIFRYFLDEWSDSSEEGNAVKCVQDGLGISKVVTDRMAVLGPLAPLCRKLGVEGKVTVSEWLARIANADFVVTNSFHGAVFAILFHKPFVALLLKGRLSGMNERAMSLLRQLRLEERMMFADDLASISKVLKRPIAWDEIDLRLSDLRVSALQFIHCHCGVAV